MAKIDNDYLTEVVKKAKTGDSNAFAELFSATNQIQYSYACRNLGDEKKAKGALQKVYIEALRTIASLQNPDLLVAWLNKINFKVCYGLNHPDHKLPDEQVAVDGRKYRMSQIMALPLTESQVLLQYYYQKLTVTEIRRNLGGRRSQIKRYIKVGRKHLRKLPKEML